ncbi:hypothetical protein PR048_030000 [Dryococelus australis]|uniref:Uncharacterized protein n=1 Tax=Dryococelus australis TaxID=614101 RepID=A0ABQ9G8I7_9NEOP|nr:hypothetical protein PR048_030000 [Dryococelus australis]
MQLSVRKRVEDEDSVLGRTSCVNTPPHTPLSTPTSSLNTSHNVAILNSGEGEVKWIWSNGGIQGRGETGESPKKIRLTIATPAMFPKVKTQADPVGDRTRFNLDGKLTTAHSLSLSVLKRNPSVWPSQGVIFEKRLSKLGSATAIIASDVAEPPISRKREATKTPRSREREKGGGDATRHLMHEQSPQVRHASQTSSEQLQTSAAKAPDTTAISCFFTHLRTQRRPEVQFSECFNLGDRLTWATAAWDSAMTPESHVHQSASPCPKAGLRFCMLSVHSLPKEQLHPERINHKRRELVFSAIIGYIANSLSWLRLAVQKYRQEAPTTLQPRYRLFTEGSGRFKVSVRREGNFTARQARIEPTVTLPTTLLAAPRGSTSTLARRLVEVDVHSRRSLSSLPLTSRRGRRTADERTADERRDIVFSDASRDSLNTMATVLDNICRRGVTDSASANRDRGPWLAPAHQQVSGIFVSRCSVQLENGGITKRQKILTPHVPIVTQLQWPILQQNAGLRTPQVYHVYIGAVGTLPSPVLTTDNSCINYACSHLGRQFQPSAAFDFSTPDRIAACIHISGGADTTETLHALRRTANISDSSYNSMRTHAVTRTYPEICSGGDAKSLSYRLETTFTRPHVKGPACLHRFSPFTAEKRGSRKGHSGTRYKSAIRPYAQGSKLACSVLFALHVWDFQRMIDHDTKTSWLTTQLNRITSRSIGYVTQAWHAQGEGGGQRRLATYFRAWQGNSGQYISRLRPRDSQSDTRPVPRFSQSQSGSLREGYQLQASLNLRKQIVPLPLGVFCDWLTGSPTPYKVDQMSLSPVVRLNFGHLKAGIPNKLEPRLCSRGKAMMERTDSHHIVGRRRLRRTHNLQLAHALSLDRRMNKVMRHATVLILHKAEEYTTCIQVDVKQGFQKCSFSCEQSIPERKSSKLLCQNYCRAGGWRGRASRCLSRRFAPETRGQSDFPGSTANSCGTRRGSRRKLLKVFSERRICSSLTRVRLIELPGSHANESVTSALYEQPGFSHIILQANASMVSFHSQGLFYSGSKQNEFSMGDFGTCKIPATKSEMFQKPMRVIEMSMEQRRNEGVGVTGDPREKHADQRHRPARFPRATIRSDPAGE